MNTWFSDHNQSHAHSLQTLNAFYEFDDFMESVRTVLDLGCGSGQDMLWWATRTTRDLVAARPLNIKCTGIDLQQQCASKHKNIIYRRRDFEDPIELPNPRYDVLWCHDSFQYAKNPYSTLLKWREITEPNGMLILIVPQTTNLVHNRQQFEALDGCFYHWTLVNLMYMLAAAGWDCRSGFFRKVPNDPWIHCVVYKDAREPLGAQARWCDLSAAGLLPESAERGINRRGYLAQQDLILSWIDKSLITYERY